LEGLFLFLFLIFLSFRGALRVPGLVTGVFVLGYGVSRFIIEFFRVPDPQFFSMENQQGFAIILGELGLTMGQLLSVPMILFGLGLVTVTTINVMMRKVT
jgi:phosphatidylglycerol:prolipoprotein diacylglycerol transferase